MVRKIINELIGAIDNALCGRSTDTMLNPSQANLLKARPFAPGVDSVFDGMNIKTVPVNVPAKSSEPELHVEVGGKLYSPEKIFGTPVEPKCLNGIGNWAINSPVPEFNKHANACIIGFSSILTESNHLLMPRELDQVNKRTFMHQHAQNPHGYAYHDLDGQFIVRHVARPKPIFRDLEALFFYNLEPGNYGSFMFRMLPQLLFAAEKGLKFDCYVMAERLPWALEALRLLGMPDKPVFTIREICGDRFKSITFCDDFDNEGFIDPRTRTRVTSLLRKILSDNGAVDQVSKLYVSRSLSSLHRPNYRVMRNEQEVEANMAKRGFEIIYPETFSFLQQIIHFVNGTAIVGPSGSGMFNVMFSRVKGRILDIETYHETVRQHAKLYASCGLEYSFLFCQPEEVSADLIIRPYEVPIPLLNDAVDWLLARDP